MDGREEQVGYGRLTSRGGDVQYTGVIGDAFGQCCVEWTAAVGGLLGEPRKDVSQFTQSLPVGHSHQFYCTPWFVAALAAAGSDTEKGTRIGDSHVLPGWSLTCRRRFLGTSYPQAPPQAVSRLDVRCLETSGPDIIS